MCGTLLTETKLSALEDINNSIDSSICLCVLNGEVGCKSINASTSS